MSSDKRYPPLTYGLEKGAKLGNHIESSERLITYLKEKAKWHQCYRHYGSSDDIIRIKENKELYLTDGSNWNDLIDREQFNKGFTDRINFGTCFSFSQEESVAMWLLYAGRGRSGGMLCLSRYDLHKIVQRPDATLFVVEENQIIYKKKLDSSDFDIYLVDVLYENTKRKGSDQVPGYSYVSHLGDKTERRGFTIMC